MLHQTPAAVQSDSATTRRSATDTTSPGNPARQRRTSRQRRRAEAWSHHECRRGQGSGIRDQLLPLLLAFLSRNPSGRDHPVSGLPTPREWDTIFQQPVTAEAGMVCGAKRIRSLYLPWMTGVTPKLSTITPPKGLASLSTINAATMRLCRADLPAPAHSSRLKAAPPLPAPGLRGKFQVEETKGL
jgi:hypothetical protein